MPRFSDLINSLGVGEDGISVAYPDTFTDDLSAAYAADMEIPEAQIQVLTAQVADLEQENLLLKAHNYTLLTQTPATDAGAGEGDGDGDGDGDDDEPTTDDLFGDDTDDDK